MFILQKRAFAVFNTLKHFHTLEWYFARVCYNRGLKKRSSDRRRPADSRLPLRSSTCSYDKISYGCPVVLVELPSHWRQTSCGTRGFADNGDTIASEFETRWFSHFLAHSGARSRKSNEYRDKLSRCKNCWNNAFDIWSDTYRDVTIGGSTVHPANWQLLLLIAIVIYFSLTHLSRIK